MLTHEQGGMAQISAFEKSLKNILANGMLGDIGSI